MTTIERIEKEAEKHALCCELTGDDAVTGILCFTAGAISERNKVIQEAIDYYKSSPGKMVDRRSLIAALETFKIKDLTP